MAFNDFITNWDGPLFNGKKALAFYWAEIGVQSGRVGFGYVSRQHYYLTFANETAQFNHLVQNNLPLELNRTYHIDIKLRHFTVNGFRVFANLFETKALKWDVGFSRLYGSRLLRGSLQGDITTVSQKDYEYN